MSIFWLGGEPIKISPKAIVPDMFEDRYFLPGIIHGGDYLIRVYLNDSHCEDETSHDHDQFEVDYITKELILKAASVDPELGQDFYDTLFEAKNFCCRNDGMSGEFAEIIRSWPESIYMTHSELVNWAKGEYFYRIKDIDWDIDEKDRECVFLPDSVWITEACDEDYIADYLSDKYGYCIRSYSVAWKKEPCIPENQTPEERCRDCGYLAEGDNKAWICEDCGKDVHDITDDECSANQKF